MAGEVQVEVADNIDYEWPAISISDTDHVLAVWENSACGPLFIDTHEISGANGYFPPNGAGGGFINDYDVVNGMDVGSSYSLEVPAVDFDGNDYTVVYREDHYDIESFVGATRTTRSGLKSTPVCWDFLGDQIENVDIAFGYTNGLIVITDYCPVNGGYYQVYAHFVDKSI